jgi:hypothetical protein
MVAAVAAVNAQNVDAICFEFSKTFVQFRGGAGSFRISVIA